MPIFYRDGKRALFVHVPKCGGSYVEALFAANGFGTEYRDTGSKPGKLNAVRRCSPQHMHASMLRTLFSIRAFDYVFMVVRDPIARLVSEYRMRHRANDDPPSIDSWTEKVLGAYHRNPFVLDNHIRPQHEFVLGRCQIFKQEDGLGRDFVAHLAQGIGIEFRTLEVEQKLVGDTLFRQPKPVPSAQAVAMAVNFYKRDFDVFGYPLPSE